MSTAATRRDAPRRISRALADAPRALSVRDLAEATGLHENAVRRALARLVRQGDVLAERQLPRTRGRPLLRYRLVGPADEPFRHLVPVLLDLLDASGAAAERAYAAGLAHAEAAPRFGHASAREAVIGSLATLGFAPVEIPSGTPGGRITLDLTRCPFADAVTTSANGRQVCHLHHGLLAGVARANGGRLDDFVINDPRATPCQVAFHAEEPALT